MTTVLVTGGNGVLGRRLVPLLIGSGHEVTVSTRTPGERADGASEIALDLRKPEGYEEAVGGHEVVVHAASDARNPMKVDVRGTSRLLAAAVSGSVEHFVYISIVGVDRHPLKYYKAKYAAEMAVEAAGIPFTILRATQFHDLVARFTDAQRRLPVVFAPRGARFQVVDVDVVAARLAAAVDAGPAGRISDIGGPEPIAVTDLVRSYLRAAGSRRPVVGFRIPGAGGKAFRDGVNLLDGPGQGPRSWEQYLEEVVRHSVAA